MPIYYTRREAAAYLKERYKRGSYPWLTRLAADGLGPRHHRFGRAILYAANDLDEWAQQNIRAADGQSGTAHNAVALNNKLPDDDAIALTAELPADDAVRKAFEVMRELRL
jgi:hypothetical protein